MRQLSHRLAARTQLLCAALVGMTLLPAGEVAAASPDSHPAAASKQARSARKPAHAKQAAGAVPTRIQTVRLRYTGLSSLPRRARSEFHAAQRSPEIEAADDAEARCARATNATGIGIGSDVVTPCLGLYRGGEVRSPIKFSFDVSLKSVGAPKDVLIGQCPAGSNNAACNNFISESKAEQERLADTLDRQRRSPVATLGVAVSF
jgi:hypothetical protein